MDSAQRKLYFLEAKNEHGNIKAVCSCSVLERKPTHWTFQLIFPERTYILRCADPAKSNAWLSAFQTVLSWQESSLTSKNSEGPAAAGEMTFPKQEKENDQRIPVLNGDTHPPWLHRQRSGKSKDLVSQHVTADIGILTPKAKLPSELAGPASFDPSHTLVGPRGPSPSASGPALERLISDAPPLSALTLIKPERSEPTTVVSGECAANEVGVIMQVKPPNTAVSAAGNFGPDSSKAVLVSVLDPLAGGLKRTSPTNLEAATWPNHPAVPKLDMLAAHAAQLRNIEERQTSSTRSRTGNEASRQSPHVGAPASDDAITVDSLSGSGVSGLPTARRDIWDRSGPGEIWMPAQRTNFDVLAAGRGYGEGSDGRTAGDATPRNRAAGDTTPRGEAWRDGRTDSGHRGPPLSPRVVLPVPVLKAETIDWRERDEAQEIVTPRGTSFFRAATKISPRNYKSFLARKFLQPDAYHGDGGYGPSTVISDAPREEEAAAAVYRLSL